MSYRVSLPCIPVLLCTCIVGYASGVQLAESDSPATFEVYSVDGATYSAGSLDEISSLPKVTWRKGETVTAAPCSGSVATLVASAESAGEVAFAPDSGGVWTLVNSAQGTARIGVAWSVYDDGGTLAESSGTMPYGIDSMQPGPNRMTPRRSALPIAYSGDSWIGDPSQSATLTIVSPGGAEMSSVLMGTGAFPFSFNDCGQWTVRLDTADISEVAVVGIRIEGLKIVVR